MNNPDERSFETEIVHVCGDEKEFRRRMRKVFEILVDKSEVEKSEEVG